MIQPFQLAGFTMVPNLAIDHIFPRLSYTARAVLLLVMRQTLGWEGTAGNIDLDTGRRARVWLTIRGIQRQAGISSTATVQKALAELLAGNDQLPAGLILQQRRPDDYRGQPAYEYALNTDYELPLTVSESDTVADLTVSKIDTVADLTVSKSDTVNGPTVSKSDTLEIKERKKAEADKSDHKAVWSAAAADLKLMMGLDTYNQLIAEIRPIAIRSNCMILAAPNGARLWLESRMMQQLTDAVSEAAGHPMTVAIEAG